MDIWSYNRKASPDRADGGLASAEFAVLSIEGEGEINLVQQFSVNYSHSVNAKFESGSGNLYWQTGQPQGVVNFGRLVGMDGFMAQFKNAFKGACGKLTKLNVDLDGNGICDLGAEPSGGLAFDGAIPVTYTMNWSAGALDVTEGAQIRVSKLSQN